MMETVWPGYHRGRNDRTVREDLSGLFQPRLIGQFGFFLISETIQYKKRET
jgi:hypothetical protein